MATPAPPDYSKGTVKTGKLRTTTLGSMDERYDAGPETADLITDMKRHPLGGWEQAGGYVRVGATGIEGVIRSLHWFTQHNGARAYLVYERVNAGVLDLCYFDFSSGVRVVIQAGRKLVEGPNPGTQYVEWNNWLYVFNGYDQPVRWNGRELIRVGFDRTPPPPNVSVANAFDQLGADYGAVPIIQFHPIIQRGLGEVSATADQPWRYGWAVTLTNDQAHESPLSELTFRTNQNDSVGTPPDDAGGFRSAVIQIEDAGAHVRAFTLWRTANVHGVSSLNEQGFAVFFHSRHQYGAPFTITDDHPDSELGIQYVANSGPFPHGVRFAAIFKNTMFVDGGSEFPGRVFFSTAGFIEQFPPDNYLPIGDRVSGDFRGFRATKNALVVMTSLGIYLIKGDPATGFFSETLTEDEGGWPMVEIPGFGLLFLNDGGPRVLRGALENTGTITRTEGMVPPIYRTWEKRVNVSALANARAVVNHRDREVWVQVPADGSDRPRLGLVWSIDAGGWSLREDYPISDFAYRWDRGYLYFSSFDDVDHEGIFAYTGVLDKDGDTLQGTYQTAWLKHDTRVLIEYFTPYILAHDRALTLEVRADRRLPYTTLSDTAYLSRDTEVTSEVWGTALWGAGFTWDDYGPTNVRTDVPAARYFESQFRIRFNRGHILGYGVGFTGEPSDILPLSTVGG